MPMAGNETVLKSMHETLPGLLDSQHHTWPCVTSCYLVKR
jgi:hypothetical protein